MVYSSKSGPVEGNFSMSRLKENMYLENYIMKKLKMRKIRVTSIKIKSLLLIIKVQVTLRMIITMVKDNYFMRNHYREKIENYLFANSN
ncbi:hypothetical protein [Pseudobacteroides cellulosolvens]|uniref:Uncharacterized protein n=1 Tax=Pseudobacteroides cellulosolvens ATCC 35603 = DSM 2933 TaxID=398512 RepID=A0A0L6JJS6_9FIRM|nr:hypothetical protein [Pseudobacteroides cellulosolvens]KNY25995.1 hypothetical protein Bccel_1256 [Pseudobacteroides cellulosolvens ATCC 35603 = DSM 2933]